MICTGTPEPLYTNCLLLQSHKIMFKESLLSRLRNLYQLTPSTRSSPLCEPHKAVFPLGQLSCSAVQVGKTISPLNLALILSCFKNLYQPPPFMHLAQSGFSEGPLPLGFTLSELLWVLRPTWDSGLGY